MKTQKKSTELNRNNPRGRVSLKELNANANEIVSLVHRGEWGLLYQAICDMPAELADHILKESNFSNSPDLDEARWLMKMYKATTKSFGARGDVTRANIIALAIVNRSCKTSKYRKQVGRLKMLDCRGLMEEGRHHVFDCRKHASFIIDFLNLALSCTHSLECMQFQSHNKNEHISFDRIQFPKMLQTLLVTAPGQMLDSRFLKNLPKLKSAQFEVSRLLLDQSEKSTGSQIKITINENILDSLDPGVALALVNEGRPLSFNCLFRLSVQDARVLATNPGALNFGSLVIDENCRRELAIHPSFANCANNTLWATPMDDLFHCSGEIGRRRGDIQLLDSKFLLYRKKILNSSSGKLIYGCDADDLGLIKDRVITRKASMMASSDLNSGCKYWETRVPQANGMAVIGDQLFVLKKGGKLVRLDIANGKLCGAVTTGLADKSDSTFKMTVKSISERLYIWNPKTKYGGDKKLIAIDPESMTIAWSAVFDGVAGEDLIEDNAGNLLFCAGSKLHRLTPKTGSNVKRPIQLGGNNAIPIKNYDNGDILVGCQKGFNPPELKCFSEDGQCVWALSLPNSNSGFYASCINNFIILNCLVEYGVPPEAWVIDRKSGKYSKTKQTNLDFGSWDKIVALDEDHLLLSSSNGLKFFKGIPSDWKLP